MKIQILDNIDNSLSLWWQISKACNFNCSYCIQQRNNIDKFKNEDAVNVANHLKTIFENSKYKLIKINITGGEPSIFDLHKIISILSSTNYKLSVLILTNLGLHDTDWWNTLRIKNVDIRITASCHLEQIKDLDSWIEKATQITNVNSIKAKFIISNDNFDEVKKTIQKCVDANLKYCLEGCRDGKTQQILCNEEIRNYIENSNNENSLSSNHYFKYMGIDCTHTSLFHKIHAEESDILKNVTCTKRVRIIGNKLKISCKYVLDADVSIFDVTDLDWTVVNNCDKLKQCNLCSVGEIKINE